MTPTITTVRTFRVSPVLALWLTGLFLVSLFCGCATSGGSSQPRPAIDVQVAVGQDVVGFARSAPLQRVHVLGFASSGRLRLLDLSTGLVLWEGTASAGEILVVGPDGSESFPPGAPLPAFAATAFAETELFTINGELTMPEYGLRFSP